MKLVIVESPTKAKTLKSILGKEYEIKASNGHIRDLPKKELGVDVESNFKPKYIIPSKARKSTSALKKAAKDSDAVVLATDPDREGEAIAWHISEIIKGEKATKDLPFERVVFHEITKSSLDEAFENPGKLSDDLVDAQQARRVLDRLVGYKLSPLLWKKVRYGLSAGRVQSVAVRLIVERERERDAFDPQEYWSIDVDFETENDEILETELKKKNGNAIEIANEKEAKGIEDDLSEDTYEITKVKKKKKKRKPYAPFRTSTLQRTASSFYGFTARRTMRAAQKLFEEGLITYHRTDSLNLSPKFIEDARKFIESELGDEYIPEKPNVYKTDAKGAQEAHEAIRPTNVKTEIKELQEKGLRKDEVKLYSLILKRSLECQMKPAVYDKTTVIIDSEGGYEFRATGSTIRFDGWLAVGKMLGFEGDAGKLNVLPEVKENESAKVAEIKPNQHFTQPPGRYSDASLIKEMEDLGIGRPSTYAPTMSTIQQRKYVEKEGRYFKPTPVAYVVTDLLVDNFPQVIDYQFTAKMEEQLDEIARGKLEWVPVIEEFYNPFEEKLEKAEEELDKREVTKLGESDEKCPKCGKTLYIKLGKYGKFLSCSGFPECDFAKPIDGEGVDEDGNAKSFGKCEECGEGEMVLKQGRYGKFLACNKYPDCKHTKPYLDKIGMKCPKCEEEGREGGEVIRKKAKGREFFGCSNYPECDYASWKNPLEENENGDNEDKAKKSE